MCYTFNASSLMHSRIADRLKMDNPEDSEAMVLEAS